MSQEWIHWYMTPVWRNLYYTNKHLHVPKYQSSSFENIAWMGTFFSSPCFANLKRFISTSTWQTIFLYLYTKTVSFFWYCTQLFIKLILNSGKLNLRLSKTLYVINFKSMATALKQFQTYKVIYMSQLLDNV